MLNFFCVIRRKIAGFKIQNRFPPNFLHRVHLFFPYGELDFHVEYLPEFLAFLFTATPFVHGMNRRLDKTKLGTYRWGAVRTES